MAKRSPGKVVPETVSPPRPEDVSSVDGVVRALYESVSFPPGSQPDFRRFLTLFHPEGRIVPPGSGNDALDLAGFVTRSRESVVTTGLERQGFSEKEVARRTGTFGSMTHLFSTFESRHTPNDPLPFQRGINSIQMVRNEARFWIVSIVWEAEGPGNPIPRAFLM